MKKNKIWKRAGAVILSTALLFGTLPTGVMAEETVGQNTNEEELKNKYLKQLDYYSNALFKITGRKVSKRYLYSFYLEKVIEI